MISVASSTRLNMINTSDLRSMWSGQCATLPVAAHLAAAKTRTHSTTGSHRHDEQQDFAPAGRISCNYMHELRANRSPGSGSSCEPGPRDESEYLW